MWNFAPPTKKEEEEAYINWYEEIEQKMDHRFMGLIIINDCMVD